MELMIMFVTHLFKTVHYWLTAVTAPELHPEIAYPGIMKIMLEPLETIPEMITEYLPAAAEALFWQAAKLAEIYLSATIK